MKWFFILLFTVQILSQERAYKLEQYEAKLERGDTLIFTNVRKNYYLILALLLSASSHAQIMISDKGYNPPADIFPPSIPSGLNGVAISDDSLLFYWTNPSDGDFNRNVIWFMGAVKDSTSNDSIYIGGLTPNVTYGLRVLSVDNNGNRSAYSDSIQRTTYDTTSSGATPPEMPTNLTVSDSTDDITLTWMNNPPNATNIVIMKNSADYDTVAYPIATWTESDTMDGVFRTYKLYAYNAGGESDTTPTVTTQRRSSNTYYFSSSGSDAGLGTVEQPYKTVGKANSLWGDGIKLKFKVDETFNDALQLLCQSNATYTSYGGNGRAIIQPSSLTSTVQTVKADNTNSTTVYGLEIIGRKFVTAQSSTYFILENNDIHHYSSADNHLPPDGQGLIYLGDVDHSYYAKIIDNIITSGYPSVAQGQPDLISLKRAKYVLVEGNYLKDVAHCLIMTDKGSFIKITHNRGYNTYHHFANLQASNHDMVVDYNYMEKQGIGVRGPVYNLIDSDIGGFYINSYNTIVRYNVVKQSGAPRYIGGEYNYSYLTAVGISGALSYYGATYPNYAYNIRMYNNVIDNNYGIGLRVLLGSDAAENWLYDNLIFNNAITRSQDATYMTGTDSVQVIVTNENISYNPSNNDLVSNYWGATDNNVIYHTTVTGPNLPQNSQFWLENNLQGTYSVFDAPDDSVTNYTYWTPQTSRGNLYDSVLAKYNGKTPLIDAGRPHTYINGTVNNDTILVDDARVFFDGWNWLEGDSLLIDTFRVQVIGINYTTNYIALSGIVNVLDNTPVYLINPYTHDAYKETAIDIGLE